MTDFRCPRCNGKFFFNHTVECADYNLKFSEDDLEKFGKSNILAIE